ncbi:ribonuclease P Rpr2/Rpp21/SNM1 subunit [Aspergillus tanneri]|uniref:Rpr2-domain-containing protein n=1 Tax=Aspergillus tanneri TaxID=1220188 RepID=A0A5M9MFY9_9EURO|nr:uncharacterized protein ATNIH1004_010188 [Aspergillus tanneri]KAA8643419.1 hypothetical protein ATNIH1004_010188 [Aspergillus tanneri]
MAKVKGKKGPSGGVNSHIRSRLNYLHAAATYLQSREVPSKQSSSEGHNESINAHEKESAPSAAHIVPQVIDSDDAVAEGKRPSAFETPTAAVLIPQLSRGLISQMRGVSLKSQLRLPVEVKRSFCKRCDSLLIRNVNCMQEVRNASRGGKKPWADVLIVRCNTCGTEKRFHQTEKRSKKLSERRNMQKQKEETTSAV